GGVILIIDADPTTADVTIERYCNFGYGGAPGIGGINGNGESWASSGLYGSNGTSGSCLDVSEVDPDGSGPNLADIANCNDHIDNDGDGYIDTGDFDCYTITIPPNGGSVGYCPSSNYGHFGLWYEGLEGEEDFFKSADDGSDGCCGDDLIGADTNNNYDYLNDYGSIPKISDRYQYMCYDSNIDLELETYTAPSWLNAMSYQGKYKIKTVKTFTGSVDAVSNGQDWYYCDANGNSVLKGIPIKEGKTFDNLYPSGQYSCADIFTNIFLASSGDENDIFYDTCEGLSDTGHASYTHNCCERYSNGNVVTGENMDDCISKQKCFLKDRDTYIVYQDILPITGGTIGPTSFFIPSDSCTGQYETVEECLEALYIALGNNGGNIVIGSSNDSFDIDYLNFLENNFNFVSNDSFICFKENGTNNVISQCCYNNSCRNNDYSQGDARISVFDRRVLTRGSSIHTLENFDIFNDLTSAQILEQLKVYRFSNGQTDPIDIQSSVDIPDLQTFSSLEFDILSDTDNLNIQLNDRELGDAYLFSNNGAKSGKWHHIIIPITPSIGYTFTEITFSTSDTENRLIIIDNLILVANTMLTLESNTQNYYCTGGFGSWVDDLDPSDEDRVANTFESLGPHHVACVGNPAYSWTGNYCCGDDTRITPAIAKEYFNDTQGGCFAGSKVRNDSSVAYAKGYLESTNKSLDELDSYDYKNLIFFNESFLGCQVPGNDINVDKYYDTTTPSNINLIDYPQDYIKSQCQVVGSYYCKDGAWRQKISTDYNATSFDDNFNTLILVDDQLVPKYEQPIALKFAPSGVELIQNGFRTE
ncbi:MAG: hypothetical protein ACP5N1_00335, partial [Candidatus Woesearchaeota archaeon]